MDQLTHAERYEIAQAMTLLGLADGFSRRDLELAYREKVTKYHPDRATDGGDLARRTRVVTRLNAARELLRQHVGYRRDQGSDVESLGERLVGFAVLLAVLLQILQVFFMGLP